MRLTRREKAILTLIIREVQDGLADKKPKSKKALAEAINGILDPWIRANDLHPENAKVMTVREFRRWFKKIEREETEGDEKSNPHRIKQQEKT